MRDKVIILSLFDRLLELLDESCDLYFKHHQMPTRDVPMQVLDEEAWKADKHVLELQLQAVVREIDETTQAQQTEKQIRKLFTDHD